MEAVLIGVLFLLVVSATTFYLYSRLIYSERKITLMENILLDIKMSMEMDREIVHKHDVPEKDPLIEPTFSEVQKDDTEYYTSVVENSEPEVKEESAEVSTEPDVNYDALSREDLVSLAEKKGLRVTKRTTKQQIISLVRDAEKNSSALPETGTDGPVGGTTGSVEGASIVSEELSS